MELLMFITELNSSFWKQEIMQRVELHVEIL